MPQQPCALKPMLKWFHSAVLMLAFAVSASAQVADELPLGDLARELRRQRGGTILDGPRKIHNNESLKDDKHPGELDTHPPLVEAAATGVSLDLNPRTAIANEISCSCSYVARAFGDLTEVVEKLPADELVKLQGPAAYTDEMLAISLYNGTEWELRELLVRFEVIRPLDGIVPEQPEQREQFRETAAPVIQQQQVAPEEQEAPAVQHSASRPLYIVELTRIYRAKGAAESYTIGQFRQEIGVKLQLGQDWRWTILEAKGVSPKKPAESQSPLTAEVK
jgi:hypothetical protein